MAHLFTTCSRGDLNRATYKYFEVTEFFLGSLEPVRYTRKKNLGISIFRPDVSDPLNFRPRFIINYLHGFEVIELASSNA